VGVVVYCLATLDSGLLKSIDADDVNVTHPYVDAIRPYVALFDVADDGEAM